MASNTSENHPVSAFEGGKIKPGIYMLQNAVGKTFADILDTKEMCCRPAAAIPGKGLVC